MRETTKKSVLIINKSQFGYHIDSLKYCEYLKGEFDVTYLCFDANKEKVVVPGVQVNYVSWDGSFLKKGRSFIKACKAEIKTGNYDKVFCVYFQGVSLLLNPSNKERLIVDIRTGFVGEKSFKKWVYNAGIKRETKRFKQVSIISDSLAKLLKIKNYFLLPLGSDILSTTDKNFSLLKLMYVGTLSNRNIHETIVGCKLFMEETGASLTYDIFGGGDSISVVKLQETLVDCASIHYHGYKHHSEIRSYFDECTVGVSYVPITPYFDVQPPTKTYEYIQSGMICLATATSENKQIVTDQNGVLCFDNPTSFATALKTILENRKNYSSDSIRSTVANSTWKNIVENQLIPILNS